MLANLHGVRAGLGEQVTKGGRHSSLLSMGRTGREWEGGRKKSGSLEWCEGSASDLSETPSFLLLDPQGN